MFSTSIFEKLPLRREQVDLTEQAVGTGDNLLRERSRSVRIGLLRPLAPVVDILEALKASLARKKPPHAEERAASAGGANRKRRSRVIG